MILLLNNLAGGSIIDTSDFSTVLMAMSVIVTGTIFLMWL